MTDISEDTQAQLAALADGTLEPERARRLREEMARSPSLAAALEEQQAALSALAAVAQAEAPTSLRDSLVAQISAASAGSRANSRRGAAALDGRPRRRRGLRTPRISIARSGSRLASAGAIALGAIGVGLAFALTGQLGPTLGRAVALTQRPAGVSTRPLPVGPARRADRLDADVDGVSFPDWRRRFGWRATGMRSVRLAGRPTTAVYYSYEIGAAKQRLGYAIVSGAPISIGGGRVVVRHGVDYRLLSVHGVPTVTWRRGGHTCVIAGPRLTSSALIALASSRAS